MGTLSGKSAIVTGAARGIGQAVAARYVAEGARVLLADIDEAAVTKAAADLGQPWVRADVACKADILAMVTAASAAFGEIDILVNNAGMTFQADLLDLEEADLDRVLAVNLKSAFLATQAVAPAMIARRSGVIINMSSVNAVLAIPNQIAYAVSKGALRQLTNVTALALAPHNVRVNAIGPGTILTDLARTIMTDQAAQARILARTPIGRCGQAEEMAGIAAFLAGDDASYITGQTIYADGGRLGLNYTMPVPA